MQLIESLITVAVAAGFAASAHAQSAPPGKSGSASRAQVRQGAGANGGGTACGMVRGKGGKTRSEGKNARRPAGRDFARPAMPASQGGDARGLSLAVAGYGKRQAGGNGCRTVSCASGRAASCPGADAGRTAGCVGYREGGNPRSARKEEG